MVIIMAIFRSTFLLIFSLSLADPAAAADPIKTTVNPEAASGLNHPAPAAQKPHNRTSSRAANNPVIVATPALQGKVDGITYQSDEFMWQMFLGALAPAAGSSPPKVEFETWATDKTTFSATPKWPGLAAPSFDTECEPAHTPLVFNFPADGCIVEVVKRNLAQFDYIVNNNLNTKQGLAAAFAKADFTVNMPKRAVSIKAEWVPFSTLKKWITGAASWNDNTIKAKYYTTNVNNTDYALVAIHVSSKQNKNWVWATFEHSLNPGRCDYTGCFDSYGFENQVELPDLTTLNGQYPKCSPTTDLTTYARSLRVPDVFIGNYCLKSTQTDYVDEDQVPTVLTNTVIEGLMAKNSPTSSSCITCHYYAAFGSNGAVNAAANAMPLGNPSGLPDSKILENLKQFDFMWGFRAAP